jgi:lipopolysaccharide/colanic/teichoic acid biosynthesis glycosyltransferase
MWRGDISLVGPRAERPELSAEFEALYPGFTQRLMVRPGMTGLAQIYGRYSTHPRDKLRYDMVYVRRMSPVLDVRLLVSSVLLTLRARWQDEER